MSNSEHDKNQDITNELNQNKTENEEPIEDSEKLTSNETKSDFESESPSSNVNDEAVTQAQRLTEETAEENKGETESVAVERSNNGNDEALDNKKENKAPKSRKELFIQRCQDASLVRKIVAVILAVLTIVIVIAGMSVFNMIQTGLSPVDSEDQSIIEVEIPLGSSSSSIADILEEAGVINDAFIYRLYVKLNNHSSFQAGHYQLSPSMTLDEITENLQTGTLIADAVFSVTIPEGRTLEEIAVLFENNANVDAEEFMELMQDESYIKTLIADYPNILSDEILDEDIRYPLEGYLFAATYPFYEESPSIDVIIRNMLNKTEQVLHNYYGEINDQNEFSVHELLTFASIVEREARDEEERREIAGVFYNRLEEGMRLETDPTVLYALGQHKDRVLFRDLEVESPYNTYRIHGLPIGPISNFGESSLQAVLNPAETSYLFFVAAPDGEIYFSETFEEHRALANEHLDRDL